MTEEQEDINYFRSIGKHACADLLEKCRSAVEKQR